MTGNLPFWIQRLLGLDVEPGYGMAWRIVWSSNWPSWLWWGLVVVAIGAVVGPYLRRSTTEHLSRRRRYTLLAVRLLGITLLLAMAGLPELQLEKTDLPIFEVVVDDSMSMTSTSTDRETASASGDEKDEGEDKTRLDRAKSVLLADQNRILREMTRRYRTNIYRLSDMTLLGGENQRELATLTQAIESLEAVGPSTRLGDAVLSILGRHYGTEPAGILLVTDGINTEGPDLKEAATAAKRLGVPIYTIGIGSEKTQPRLKLSDLTVEDVVFVGDTLRFQALLHGPGHEGKTVHVDLYRKEPATSHETTPDETTPAHEATLLDEAELTIPPDGLPVPVQLHYAPQEEGTCTFIVSIREEKGAELQRTIRAYKEQIRVLLAASRPSYEYRFLRNLLHREPSIQPTTFLADADPRNAEQDPIATPVFPVRRETLFEYDVVILIDLSPRELGQRTMENLAAFVQDTDKGGAIVFVAGPNVPPSDYLETPLARLLPVDADRLRLPDEIDETEETGKTPDGFRMIPTKDGLQQPPLQLGDTTEATEAIWRKLPTLHWMLTAESLKPAARVWAINPSAPGEATDDPRYREGLPMLVMQYVGAGRVLMQLTDETWRWRADERLDVYNRYWLQTVRFLARSKLIGSNHEVTLSTEKTNYRYGETVRLQLKFHDPRLAPDRDDGVQLSIRRQSGPTQSLPLRRSTSRSTFTGTLTKPAIGNYHASLRVPTLEGVAPPSVDFAIEAPPGEFTETRMNADGLRDASKQTAGHFFTPADSHRLVSSLPKGHPITIEPLPPYPLWNRWPVLLILLALFTTEWTLRRRWNL